MSGGSAQFPWEHVPVGNWHQESDVFGDFSGAGGQNGGRAAPGFNERADSAEPVRPTPRHTPPPHATSGRHNKSRIIAATIFPREAR